MKRTGERARSIPQVSRQTGQSQDERHGDAELWSLSGGTWRGCILGGDSRLGAVLGRSLRILLIRGICCCLLSVGFADFHLWDEAMVGAWDVWGGQRGRARWRLHSTRHMRKRRNDAPIPFNATRSYFPTMVSISKLL